MNILEDTADRRVVRFLQVDALLSAAVTRGALATGTLCQNPAHGLGGGSEEVRATIPPWLVGDVVQARNV